MLVTTPKKNLLSDSICWNKKKWVSLLLAPV